MSLIYEPKGKAGEYSPLAVNIYKGCNHGCFYCYVPKIMKVFNKEYIHENVDVKQGFINTLSKEAKSYKGIKMQVLLSFTSDPYGELENEYNLTTETVKILCENEFPVAILTKSGLNPMKDIDLFAKYKDRIKIGASLTFINDVDTKKHETQSAMYNDRIQLLKNCKELGIKTWASIEPVIDPIQSLQILRETIGFIDQYKIGKLNHYKEIESKINWNEFMENAVTIMRNANKEFMVKEDLAKFDYNNILTESEKDAKKMWIKPIVKTSNSLGLF